MQLSCATRRRTGRSSLRRTSPSTTTAGYATVHSSHTRSTRQVSTARQVGTTSGPTGPLRESAASHCTQTTCRLPASRSTVRLLQMTGRTFRSTVMAPGCGLLASISSAPARTGFPSYFAPLWSASGAISTRLPLLHVSTSGKRVGQRFIPPPWHAFTAAS